MSCKVPFGSNTSRNVINVHPKWMKQVSAVNLGPGCYDINLTGNKTRHSTAASYYSSLLGWKRQYEVKRLASIPNYSVGISSCQRNLSKEILDLAIQHIKRSEKSKTNDNPGVGTYGVKGDPYLYKEEMDAKHKSPSTKGLLERGGDGSRSLPSTGCHLAPGTYEVSGSIEELLNKKTGNRGPYDLMTGPRSYDKVSEYPEPGTYPVRSFTSDLLRSEKRYTGKFRRLVDENKKMDKCYSTSVQNKLIASKLGPSYYDPNYPSEGRKSFNRQMPSFLSSSSRDAHSLFSVRRFF
ncbi:unnamed protein product [Heterobilharzia americana]|nr:unnamed protein product [Heterobilharzia americana]